MKKKLSSGFEATDSRDELPDDVQPIMDVVAGCMSSLRPMFAEGIVFTLIARHPSDEKSLIIITGEEDLDEVISDMTKRQEEMSK